jgi:flagellar motor switch protein FliG
MSQTTQTPVDDAVSFGGNLRPDSPGGVMPPLEPLDGASRAAVVLLTLGPDLAGQLLETFSPAEIQLISERLQSVRTLSREQLCDVLSEFRSIAKGKSKVSFDTDEFMRSILAKVGVGSAAQESLESRLPAIEMLSEMGAQTLFDKLRFEHPQVIAILLVMLPPDLSAEVLECFDDQAQTELLIRVALLDRVEPSALSELNDVLKHSFGAEGGASSGFGGSRSAAEILEQFSEEKNKEALNKLRLQDEKLAEKVQAQMFGFGDLVLIEASALQRILAEIPAAVLAVALKGAGESIHSHFFANMSSRNTQRVQFEMSGLPPMRIKEIEEAQREVVSVARRLEERQEVSLERQGRTASSDNSRGARPFSREVRS